MTYKEVREFANAKLIEYGLYQQGWRFVWDKAKRRLGQCCHQSQEISMSRIITPYLSEEDAKDVVLHEIAHALVDSKHGHNKIWKAKCREIGARPERCGRLPDNIPDKHYNYVGYCPSGHKTYKVKKPTRDYSCSKCSNSFNPKYKIKWERVKQ